VNKLENNYNFPTIRFRRSGTRLFRANSLSRFKNYEIVEYQGQQTLESWRPLEIAEQDTDRIFQVSQAEHRRPDLVCLSIYKNTDRLYWVILSQNRILDPFVEVISGLSLRTPAYSRVITELTG